MFVPAGDRFRLSPETRERVLSRGSRCPAESTHRALKPAAVSALVQLAREAVRHQWGSFVPGDPQIATRWHFDVATGGWVDDAVVIQMDTKPFGRGAVRECFRMKEVHLNAAREPGATSDRLTFQAIAFAVLELSRGRHRTLWVAKRSIADHHRKFLHREACQNDVIHQTLAKHYAELFNREVHRRSAETGLGRCGAHDVDFLLPHMIELSDGRTFGVEAFMFGDYTKHNTNNGHTLGSRTTPQAFSYFTFIQSGRRLMIVDIQGVGDLYTDPVIHSLPSHFSGAMTDDLRVVPLLPYFALSPHEERQGAPLGAETVSDLIRWDRHRPARAGAAAAGPPGRPPALWRRCDRGPRQHPRGGPGRLVRLAGRAASR
ncbi:unnamed protein product, partial [Prorocentrum cordatum]